jgi:thioesterase domain-containing protein/acyl carrier protein
MDQMIARRLEPGAPATGPFGGSPGASRQARRAVARAWRSVLDRGSLRADLPFDEAGGDSLRLLRLVFELETTVGTSLPMDAFLLRQRPTEMAVAVDRCLTGADEPAAVDAPVLFLLAGIGGDTPRLAGFRAGCAPDIHVELVDYGEWPDLLGPGYGMTTLIGRIAGQIAARAPDGPVLLAGYSYGGMIIGAVAARLRAAGREVALMVILDTVMSAAELGNLGASPPTRLRNLRAIPDWIRAGEMKDRVGDFAANRLLTRQRPRLLAVLARIRRTWLPFGMTFHINDRMRLRRMRDLMAEWRRRPEPLPALAGTRVVMFRARQRGATNADEAVWRAAYPDLVTIEVPGDHETMLDPPHLAVLCEQLSACMACVDREVSVAWVAE